MDNLATVVLLRHKRDEIREQLNAAQKHYTEVFLSEYRVKVGDEIKRGLERIKVIDIILTESDELFIHGRRVTRSGKLSGIYQEVPKGKRWETEGGRPVYDED